MVQCWSNPNGSILIAHKPDMPEAERAAIFDEHANQRRIYATTTLDKLPDVVLVLDLVTRGGNPA
jgi:hypothetical protein